jgi:hypothetical protein
MINRYIIVSGIIFGFIALAQLLRAVNQVPAQVGDVAVPVWVSWVAAVLAGIMCAWAFASRKNGP